MIDPETISVLRGYAQGILSDDIKSTVTVMRRQRKAENDYGLTGEEYVEGGTYLGWVVSTTSTDIVQGGGLTSSIAEFELRLPIDAICDPGDQVTIGGELFTVQDTNNEDSIPMFLEATIRRVQ